jgi:hypothetical protein
MAYYLLKDSEPEEGEFYEYWYDFMSEQQDENQKTRRHDPDFGRQPNSIFPFDLP